MPLSPLAKRRLTKLADHMATLPPENFHLGAWVKAGACPRAELNGLYKGQPDVKILKSNFCSTPACVLGTAALMPSFKRAGLKLAAFVTPLDGEGIQYISHGFVVFGEAKNVLAGECFFDINWHHAEIIFGVNRERALQFYKALSFHDITPKKVAVALHKYIRHDGDMEKCLQ